MFQNADGGEKPSHVGGAEHHGQTVKYASPHEVTVAPWHFERRLRQEILPAEVEAAHGFRRSLPLFGHMELVFADCLRTESVGLGAEVWSDAGKIVHVAALRLC